MMKVRIETITPQIAARYLEKNRCNRQISQTNLTRYAKALGDGEWRENGEPIIFGPTGDLFDGQHRLTACVLSNVPFRCVVVTVDDEESRWTIDKGKLRTLGDELRMSGFGGYAGKIVSAARSFLEIRDTGQAHGQSKIKYHSDQVVRLWIESHPEIEHFVQLIDKAPAPVPRTASTTAIIYITSQVDQAESSRFAKDLFSGAGLEGDDPVFVLRARAINGIPNSLQARHDYSACIVKAWNLRRRGIKVSRLWLGSKEPYPRIDGWKGYSENLAD
jgi:hypothetical protein